MLLVILRGLPGSGKSTKVSKLVETFPANSFHAYCSTDLYWTTAGGEYVFDATHLGHAHRWNFDNAARWMDIECPRVIIDNTNITLKEFKKYVSHAQSRDYEIVLVEPDTGWRYDAQTCFERNTHGVPFDTIAKMANRWQSTRDIVRKLGIEEEHVKHSRILAKAQERCSGKLRSA